MDQRDKISIDPNLVIDALRQQLSDVMFENVKLRALITQMQKSEEAPQEGTPDA